MLWQILNRIGLAKKESRVYLSLLEFGTQPASIIAKKADLNRTTCYVILNKLIDKGLVSSFDKQNLKYFTASSPESLINFLDKKEDNIIEMKNFLCKNMEALLDISKKLNVKPKVQFFEGLEGIKSVYMDTIKENGEILSFWAIDELPQELKKFLFNTYIPERAKMKIPIKVIAPNLPGGKEIQKRDTEENRKTLLSPKNFPLKIEINIYSNKIAFMAYTNKEYAGVIIENERINKSLKSIFEMVWIYCSHLSINKRT